MAWVSVAPSACRGACHANSYSLMINHSHRRLWKPTEDTCVSCIVARLIRNVIVLTAILTTSKLYLNHVAE